MKKIVSTILIAMLGAFPVFATHDYDSTAVSNTVSDMPSNVKTIDLHTKSTNQTKDTLLTTRCNLYGPFNLNMNKGPMFKYMCIKGDVVTGTGPTIAVDFCVIPGLLMKDTVSNWVSACTLGVTSSAGAVNVNVDLSSYIGKAIVIKTHNYDAQTGSIPGYLGIGFKEDVSRIFK